MRVLLCSLLRLGDTLMHQQVRNALKKQYPEAQITWMINDSNETVQELLSPEDEVLVFPRKSFQNVAQLKTIPIGAPEMVLNQWIQLVADRKYDWAINLSHDRISGYILSDIKADKKTGLEWTENGWKPFDNQWTAYMNEHMGSDQKSDFHYCDILLKMIGIESNEPAGAVKKKSNYILIQPLTGDVKINWQIENFLRIESWIEKNTDYKVFYAGAPSEEKQLSEVFASEKIKILGLSELQSFVANAAYVLTGDTSIAHIAALQQTTSVTLSLGSSNPVKISAYGPGHWVLSAETECRPCHHQNFCTKVSHLCSEDLHPEYVEGLLDYLINGQRPLEWKQERIAIRQTIFELNKLKLIDVQMNSNTISPNLNEEENERRITTLF